MGEILGFLLVVAILGAFLMTCWTSLKGCATGDHNWYTGPCSTDPAHMTCRTYGRTGPLPGEVSHLDHWPSNGGSVTYRKERVCLDCDHAEYWDGIANKWRAIPQQLLVAQTQ